MKPYRRALVAAVSAIAAAGPSLAASPAAPAPLGYVCHRASAPLQIDGRLDDPAWRDAPWTADFVQRAYREGRKRWARTLDEEVTTDLFQASVDLRLPDGTTQRWNIRQDALVWPD